MATIVEELVLYDRFTNTFTSYIAQGQKAANATQQAQKQIEEMGKKSASAATNIDGLTGKIKSLVGAYVGLQGLKTLFTLSDTLSSTTARLDMMNDGLQTTEELNEMIYQSAMRSRGSYQQTADMVAKLGTLAGDAFKDVGSAGIVQFAEQLNKQMVLSGATTQGMDAAMLQLTQALSSGALRGEELNSILEQTPLIAQTIAGYLGVSTGDMRKLASEGKVTAEVVKNAILGAAEETNAKFESMPLTWAQVWTMAQNIATKALQPVLNFISFLANNIEIIIPLVLSLVSVIGLYLAATKGAAAVTAVWTAAQAIFNAVMALNPVVWVIGAIILLIGLIFAVIAAINKFTGSNLSAIGIITGALAVAGAFVWNLFAGLINGIMQLLWTVFVEPFLGIIEWILNVVNGGFDSLGDAVANLIGNIISWFLSLAKVVTKIIDTIFGFNWTESLTNLQNKVLSWGKSENSITINRDLDTGLSRIEYSNAWNAGYGWGEGLFSDSNEDMASVFDNTGMASDLNSIAGDTSSIAKAVSMSEEDLSQLVDMASQKYVNNINLTSQSPVITVQGANTGNTARDRQNLADAIKMILLEQSASATVNAYAHS